jgi:hypothetical protein
LLKADAVEAKRQILTLLWLGMVSIGATIKPSYAHAGYRRLDPNQPCPAAAGRTVVIVQHRSIRGADMTWSAFPRLADMAMQQSFAPVLKRIDE